MAIDSIGGLSTNTSPLQSNTLGLEDFMKILMTQLTYQDPLKPMDNQQFLAQLAQFTGLQLQRETSETLKQLLSVQSANQSIGLLGKTVDVQGDDGSSSSTGQVTTLRFANSQPLLTVMASNGGVLTDVPLSRISLVRQ